MAPRARKPSRSKSKKSRSKSKGGGRDELTIEQLASKRDDRAQHPRPPRPGLLPPPEVRGRAGFYGAEHLSRLRLIQEMQADGFNLGDHDC